METNELIKTLRERAEGIEREYGYTADVIREAADLLESYAAERGDLPTNNTEVIGDIIMDLSPSRTPFAEYLSHEYRSV